MKTDLYATSVTDISFHFSEIGCHAATHLLTFLPLTRKIFLPLTGGILQATPSTSILTTPKPESHFHVLNLLEHLSCIFLSSEIDCKPNILQSKHTSLLPCHIPSFPLLLIKYTRPAVAYVLDFPLLLFHKAAAETWYHSRRVYSILV